eukprot:SAG31_NODE_4020_length_3660_cov_2.623701_2_plen_115_part_00
MLSALSHTSDWNGAEGGDGSVAAKRARIDEELQLFAELCRSEETTEDSSGAAGSWPCTDFDRSGSVDVSDLLIVLSEFGTTHAELQPLTADANDDGAVDVSDLLNALQQFGGPC